MYHAAVGTLHALLRSLGYAFEGTVLGFEVHDCGPVVAYKHPISISLSSRTMW